MRAQEKTAAADASFLIRTAGAFMSGPENDLNMTGGSEPAFALPLIGFAAGNDPLWEEYKEHVGPFHWTPLEAFALRYPQEKIAASDLTVMAWVLPQTEKTRNDNKKQKKMPAERWARARIFGEHVHHALHRTLLSALAAQNIQAVSPVLLDEWKMLPSDKFTFASKWSERHAAHAAGLGTFGLCDGLITPAGKAMRVGSLVMRLNVPATPRPYTQYREYCLFFSSGICGACIKRCPANAISANGHDKTRCKEYLYGLTAPYVEETWHFKGYGCGLCQTKVPCEKNIPRRREAGPV